MGFLQGEKQLEVEESLQHFCLISNMLFCLWSQVFLLSCLFLTEDSCCFSTHRAIAASPWASVLNTVTYTCFCALYGDLDLSEFIRLFSLKSCKQMCWAFKCIISIFLKIPSNVRKQNDILIMYQRICYY